MHCYSQDMITTLSEEHKSKTKQLNHFTSLNYLPVSFHKSSKTLAKHILIGREQLY